MIGILNELSGKERLEPEVTGLDHVTYLDVPRRLYIHMGWFGYLTIGEKTQGYLPFLGTLPWKWKWAWWWIVWRPSSKWGRKPGWLYRNHPELYNK